MNVKNIPILDSQWLAINDSSYAEASFSSRKKNRYQKGRKNVQVSPMTSTGPRVDIYSNDHFATMGIRFCLEKYPGLRLSMHNDIDSALYQVQLHLGILIIINPSDEEFYCILKMFITDISHELHSHIVIVSDRHGPFMNKLSCGTGAFSYLSLTNSIPVMNDEMDKLFDNYINGYWAFDENHDLRCILSARERAIVLLLADNYTCLQIANHLGMNIKTVYYHKSVAMKKFSIEKKIEEAWLLFAIRSGVLNL